MAQADGLEAQALVQPVRRRVGDVRVEQDHGCGQLGLDAVAVEEDGVAVLRLSRPERLNTMTPAFFPAVRDEVLKLNAEGRTRVLQLLLPAVMKIPDKIERASLAGDLAAVTAEGADLGQIPRVAESAVLDRVGLQDGVAVVVTAAPL